MSNSKGNYLTRYPSLHYYDKLPPTARAALQNAVVDWHASPLLTRWRRGTNGYKTGPDIAARVAEWDATWLAAQQKKGKK